MEGIAIQRPGSKWDPNALTLNRDVVDGLEIRHAVEEDVALCKAAVGYGAKGGRERQCFRGEV